MREEIVNIITQALQDDVQNRQQYIRQLADLIPSRDTAYAQAALKDVSLDSNDIGDIISGEHYKKWMENNVKKIEEQQLTMQQTTSNMESVHTARNEMQTLSEFDNGDINVGDKLHIEVDPARLLVYALNGEMFLFNTPSNDTNSKVMKWFDAFSSKLSKKDQQKVFDGINEAVQGIINKEKGNISLEKFINGLNKNLSEEERLRLLALLYKKANDVFYKHG